MARWFVKSSLASPSRWTRASAITCEIVSKGCDGGHLSAVSVVTQPLGCGLDGHTAITRVLGVFQGVVGYITLHPVQAFVRYHQERGRESCVSLGTEV